MSAIYILWLRELKRYTRSRRADWASLGQPILFLVALGFGLGSMFTRRLTGETTSTSSRRELFPWPSCSTRCFRGLGLFGTGNSDF